MLHVFYAILIFSGFQITMLYSNYNAEQILANIRKAKDFQSDDLKMDMSYVIHHMPAVDSLQISEADEVTESTEPKEDTNQMSNAAVCFIVFLFVFLI